MRSENQQNRLTELSQSIKETKPETPKRQSNQPNSTAWKAALLRFSGFM
jgi:hypothetical protein